MKFLLIHPQCNVFSPPPLEFKFVGFIEFFLLLLFSFCFVLVYLLFRGFWVSGGRNRDIDRELNFVLPLLSLMVQAIAHLSP